MAKIVILFDIIEAETNPNNIAEKYPNEMLDNEEGRHKRGISRPYFAFNQFESYPAARGDSVYWICWKNVPFTISFGYDSPFDRRTVEADSINLKDIHQYIEREQLKKLLEIASRKTDENGQRISTIAMTPGLIVRQSIPEEKGASLYKYTVSAFYKKYGGVITYDPGIYVPPPSGYPYM